MLYHLLDMIFDRPLAYQNVMFRSVVALVTSFAVAMIIGPSVIRLLIRLRIGDVPDFDHDGLNRLMQDKSRTPTMGGVILLISALLATFLWADLTNFYIRMAFFCGLWLGVLGMVDDYLKLTSARRQGGRDGLKSWEKLIFQIGLTVLLAYFVYQYGEVNALVQEHDIAPFKQLTIPFYKPGVSLSLAGFTLIAALVIVGTSNAVNLTDGMDGLAAGCLCIVGFAFMILCFVAGTRETATYLLLPWVPQSDELAIVCASVVGACLGFLWFNCYPASVFMGDTGSLAMGGLLGYVAIVVRQELMLFIIGGVFVIEALSVILQVGYFKASGGKRLFKVAPIHHHFQMLGWPETKIVVRFWLVAAIFAALALVTVKLR